MELGRLKIGARTIVQEWAEARNEEDWGLQRMVGLRLHVLEIGRERLERRVVRLGFSAYLIMVEEGELETALDYRL